MQKSACFADESQWDGSIRAMDMICAGRGAEVLLDRFAEIGYVVGRSAISRTERPSSVDNNSLLIVRSVMLVLRPLMS